MKRCPECGESFATPPRWWSSIWLADASRADRRERLTEITMGSLGVLFMIAGFALWCVSPSYATRGMALGLSTAFRFRADGCVLILTLAALWYCRETDEPMHIALPIVGLACLLYGLISYFLL